MYLSSVSSTGWYMAPRTFLPNRSLSMLSTFTYSRQAMYVRRKKCVACLLHLCTHDLDLSKMQRACEVPCKKCIDLKHQVQAKD